MRVEHNFASAKDSSHNKKQIHKKSDVNQLRRNRNEKKVFPIQIKLNEMFEKNEFK